MMKSAISSDASTCRLFVTQKTTALLMLFTAGKLWNHHKTFWILLPPILQFKVLKEKFLFHKFWFWLNPTTIESLIKIVPYLLLAKMEQWLRCNSRQFGLENLTEGIAIIILISQLTAWSKNDLNSPDDSSYILMVKKWALWKFYKFYKPTMLKPIANFMIFS